MRSMLSEGQRLAPSARTLWEIQAFAQKPPVETASNLYISIRDRAKEYIERSRAAREAITDIASLRARQEAVRQAFLDSVGGLPAGDMLAGAEVTSRVEKTAFRAENIILETQKNRFATCTVYTPRGFSGRRPAVLLVIGHTDEGKADAEYRYAAQLFCAAGFVVLALDPYGEGERQEHYDPEGNFQPIQGCSGEHDLMDWKFKLMGVSLARWFLADALAAVSYLKSRSDVDPNRVALTGHSGGGTQTSLLMLAASDEFACAAPCAYISDMHAMIDEGVDPDNEMIWPGSLEEGIDYADILLAMAPKPVLVLANAHDFFPLEGTKRAVREARAVFGRLGFADPPETVTAQSEHAYGKTLASAARDFFVKHLGGGPAKEPYVYEDMRREELFAAGGCLMKCKPDMRTLQDVATDLLESLSAGRTAAGQSLECGLRKLLRADRIAPGGIRVYKEGLCAPYAFYCVVLRPEKGLWLNGVLLRNMRLPDGPLPTTVMLWPGGTLRIAEHSYLIHKTVLSDRQVLILDLPGEGALLPSKLGGSDLYVSWSTMYKLNAYLIQLGDSLCALRTRGVIAAIEALRDSCFVSDRELALCGEGDMDKCAAFAALLSDAKLIRTGQGESYGEIVRSEYHDQTHTHAWALPGILTVLDTDELAEELKGRDKLI